MYTLTGGTLEEFSYSPRALGDGLAIEIYKHQVQYFPVGALFVTFDSLIQEKRNTSCLGVDVTAED